MPSFAAPRGPDGRVSEAVVLAAVVASLVLGIALYNVVPISGARERGSSGAAVLPSSSTASGGAGGGHGSTDASDLLAAARTGTDGLLGVVNALLPGALAQGATADGSLGLPATPDVPDAPSAPDAPEVPAPACPTSVASDAYESVVDPASAAIGKPLPRDNVRLLAEIAAGCSTESPTTPVIGLALDLSRLLPDTGLAPIDLSAVPNVAAPEIPPAVIDALGSLADPIRDGCANVGLLGVLVAVIPGAAHIPVYGSDLAKVVTPAQTLCAQFER